MKRKFNKKHHSSLINIYALLTFSIKKKKKKYLHRHINNERKTIKINANIFQIFT